MAKKGIWAFAMLGCAVFAAGRLAAFPLDGRQTLLPVTTELNEDALIKPREAFHSELNRGHKSYLVNLGDLAFNSPSVLGGVARQAGMSCGTCHVNGAANPKFYMPKMSGHPGTFDTTGPLFNPKADNLVFDPVRIPSLRGARFLGPYGHDGRIASLRDFVHNVIVNEFAGPEPSPALLDAMIAYIQDIDFLANPNLGPGGRLGPLAMDSEQRGEALFFKPFPHDPKLSCAGCHVPSAAFVDHQQHDVGSGGLFKTPTLLNANYNAPYFHDGRFDSYDQVVAFFNRSFDLGLSDAERQDLVIYLQAVGAGMSPNEYEGYVATTKELNDFASVLGTAIANHDRDVIALAVDTIGAELRDLTEQYPDRKDTSLTPDGLNERMLVRQALKEQVLTLRRIDMAAADGRFDDAAADYELYRGEMKIEVPTLLYNAEQWSLFNPKVHDAHYAALRQALDHHQKPQ
ncbi:cytochrome c peroxidase [Bradyrhizobium sp. ORS 111]|uniref:cytochrome c peroxidase n=1 Tax=Bradyrhizobium sp. ORS 111 TaxID=1685958 RepID=UPI00388F3E8E